MNTLLRSGIVTVAGVVAIGAIGVGIASVASSDDGNPAGRPEDTSTSWVVPDDTDDNNDDAVGNNNAQTDNPTNNTAPTNGTR